MSLLFQFIIFNFFLFVYVVLLIFIPPLNIFNLMFVFQNYAMLITNHLYMEICHNICNIPLISFLVFIYTWR